MYKLNNCIFKPNEAKEGFTLKMKVFMPITYHVKSHKL